MALEVNNLSCCMRFINYQIKNINFCLYREEKVLIHEPITQLRGKLIKGMFNLNKSKHKQTFIMNKSYLDHYVYRKNKVVMILKKSNLHRDLMVIDNLYLYQKFMKISNKYLKYLINLFKIRKILNKKIF